MAQRAQSLEAEPQCFVLTGLGGCPVERTGWPLVCCQTVACKQRLNGANLQYSGQV